MVHQQQFTFSSAGHGSMRDITGEVAGIVERSGVQTGVAQVFCLGSTAAVGAIEFEPGLQRDLPELLDRLIPPSRQYGHEQTWHDGNGHSHLQATLLGPSSACPSATANSCWAPGSRFFTWNATSAAGSEPCWSRSSARRHDSFAPDDLVIKEAKFQALRNYLKRQIT